MNTNVARLKMLRESIHKDSMKYIDIVTTCAGEQMKIENIVFDPKHMNVNKLIELAAKRLDINVEEIHKCFIDLLVLEGMIEIV